MTIRHQKISGEYNTDPDLVGGEDWDADHALGEDTMLPVSATSLVWNSGYSTMSTYARSRGTSLVTRDSAGVYYFTFNDGTPPIMSGMVRYYTAIHSASPRGSWPAGWRSEVSVADGTVTLRVFDDTNTLADPTLSVDFAVTVFLCVDPAG